MREATGNLVPVQGEDARPLYPWPPTLMPDSQSACSPPAPVPLSSTVDCRLSSVVCFVCLSVHSLGGRGDPPSLDSHSLSPVAVSPGFDSTYFVQSSTHTYSTAPRATVEGRKHQSTPWSPDHDIQH